MILVIIIIIAYYTLNGKCVESWRGCAPVLSPCKGVIAGPDHHVAPSCCGGQLLAGQPEVEALQQAVLLPQHLGTFVLGQGALVDQEASYSFTRPGNTHWLKTCECKISWNIGGIKVLLWTPPWQELTWYA